jgi:hypothetical protein
MMSQEMQAQQAAMAELQQQHDTLVAQSEPFRYAHDIIRMHLRTTRSMGVVSKGWLTSNRVLMMQLANAEIEKEHALVEADKLSTINVGNVID